MAIPVVVNGAKGRMGRQTVEAVRGDSGLELVGEADLGDDLPALIARSAARVVIDFTAPAAAYPNAVAILEAGAHPVIGTTGMTPEQLESLRRRCGEAGRGAVVAPNFAIGAVLMMRFAAQAARHLRHVEIIELHHDGKAEAPSGTAIKTAEMIAAARPQAPQPKTASRELAQGALGARGYGVPIHSVRLPGHVAHQEVILAGAGESLRIRHDTIGREAFMPGVLLACHKVVTLKQLIYGLEHLLDLPDGVAP